MTEGATERESALRCSLLFSVFCVWASRAGHSNTINLYVCRGGALWLAYHRTQTQSATQCKFLFNPSTDIDSYYSYDTRTRQKCFIRTGYSFQPSIRLNSSYLWACHSLRSVWLNPLILKNEFSAPQSSVIGRRLVELALLPSRRGSPMSTPLPSERLNFLCDRSLTRLVEPTFAPLTKEGHLWACRSLRSIWVSSH